MNNSHRVILNTLVLYLSLIIRIGVGLISARLVLNALGETNYGVYMVVAGIIATLDFLTTSMSNSSMRFLATSLGSGDKDRVLKTFNTTVYIHYLMALVVVVILEVGGYLMFEYIVNIPTDKTTDAHIVYQFMIVTVVINVVAVPYDAVMNAHEKIYILSLFSVIAFLMSLIGAIVLCYYSGNKLIFYGLYQLLIAVIIRLIKVRYAKMHFEECRKISKKYFDRNYYKSIFSYNGWNLLGTFSGVGLTQMRKLIINQYFGVKLNTSEGVAHQVNSYINSISVSMTQSIDPQLMKSEGAGDSNRMVHITEISSKYSAFLFVLIGIPFFLEASTIFKVWLNNVPEYTVLFAQLYIIYQILEKFTFQITRAIRAVGNIKRFTIADAIACWAYIPVIIILYRRGAPPEAIYYLTIATSLFSAVVRFYYGRKLAGVNSIHFIKTAITPIIIPLIFAFSVAWLITVIFPNTLWRVVITTFVFCSVFISIFWFIGIKPVERKQWTFLISSSINKFHRKTNK